MPIGSSLSIVYPNFCEENQAKCSLALFCVFFAYFLKNDILHLRVSRLGGDSVLRCWSDPLHPGADPEGEAGRAPNSFKSPLNWPNKYLGEPPIFFQILDPPL